VQLSVSQVQTLLCDNENHQFSQLGLSLLVTRLKREFSKEPSDTLLQRSTQEINGFLKKYEKVLGKDHSLLSTL